MSESFSCMLKFFFATIIVNEKLICFINPVKRFTLSLEWMKVEVDKKNPAMEVLNGLSQTFEDFMFSLHGNGADKKIRLVSSKIASLRKNNEFICELKNLAQARSQRCHCHDGSQQVIGGLAEGPEASTLRPVDGKFTRQVIAGVTVQVIYDLLCPRATNLDMVGKLKIKFLKYMLNNLEIRKK